MCLPPVEEAFTLVLVRVDEAYSSVCISRRHGMYTHSRLGGTGVASVHTWGLEM